jgi:hypothetical protein
VVEFGVAGGEGTELRSPGQGLVDEAFSGRFGGGKGG